MSVLSTFGIPLAQGPQGTAQAPQGAPAAPSGAPEPTRQSLGVATQRPENYVSDAVPGAELSGWSPIGYEKPLSTLSPSDLVMVGGMRTPAQVAEHLGLIERIPGAPHGYRPTSKGQAEADERTRAHSAKAAEHDAKVAAHEAEVALPHETAELISAVRAAVPSHVQSAAFDEITSGAGLSDRTLSMAAHHLGKSIHETKATVARIADALSDQVGRVMAQEGVDDADDFNAWVEATGRSGSFKSAQRLHLYTGQLHLYRDLAKAYLRDTAGERQKEYAAAQRPEDYSVRMVGNTAVVKLPNGPEMPVDAALKLGLLKLGRGR